MGAGMNADGRLEVFARGSDSALWHLRRGNGDHRLEVFGLDGS
jgi:hypothetical protein